MTEKILRKIDRFFIQFLRLEKNIRPVAVKKVKDEILVLITEPNQRYTEEKKMEDLLRELNTLRPTDKQRLGLAVGKIIASNLTISF